MALCTNEDEKLFDCRILSYIEEGKSAVVKRLLESSGKFCDLVDSSGLTLLHYAAGFSNVKVLEYLISSGSDVDAKDNNGWTPLMLAVWTRRPRRRKTIVKLLEANARIDIKDFLGVDALRLIIQLLIRYDHKPCECSSKIFKRFLLRLKKECSNDGQWMAKRLLEVNCPLHFAVMLQNTVVTAIMLKSRAIGRRELATALGVAMSTADLPNVKLLIEIGAVDACGDEHPLLWYPMTSKDDTPRQLEMLKILMSRSDFDIAELQAKKFCMLANSSRDVVRILLEHVDLRTEVMFEGPRGAFKSMYLHGLMANPNPGIVNELPADANLDFDRTDSWGGSCLACAVGACNVSTVEFLLGKGIQINGVNICGCNVLFKAFHANPNLPKTRLKIMNILLKYGADVQCTSHKRETLFDFAFPFAALIQPVIAHLAMLESLGKPIAQLIYDQIESHHMFKSHLKLCKSRLERMKRITVHKSVTLYKLLTGSDAKVMLYVQNREFPDRFNRLMRGRRRSNAYYDFLLRRRTFECIQAARLKKEAAVAISEILQVDNHTVTDNVLGYLSADDWKSLRDVH